MASYAQDPNRPADFSGAVSASHTQLHHQDGGDSDGEDAAGGKKKTKGAKRRKVNHACLYCRRSHMTCDEGRPCQRCIKREIGHLCHDERRPSRSEKQSESSPSSTQLNMQQAGSSSYAAQSIPAGGWPSMSVSQSGYMYPQFESFGKEFSVLSDFLDTLDEQAFFNPPTSVAPSSLVSGTYANPEPEVPAPPITNATQTSRETLLSETNREQDGAAQLAQSQERSSSAQDQSVTVVLPAASMTEKFLLTAADQEPGTRDERLKRVIKTKYEAGLLKPYNYVKGVSQESKQQILQPLSVLRPKFRAIAQSLRDIDLVFIEEAFERLLLDYDRVFSAMGIPACLWRRTGEIYKGNREFAELVGVDGYMLRDGRLCIYELMAEESAVNYWEKYGNVAFDSTQKAVLTSCVLRFKPMISAASGTSTPGRRLQLGTAPNEEGFINCCFSFTIRRDTPLVRGRYNLLMAGEQDRRYLQTNLRICILLRFVVVCAFTRGDPERRVDWDMSYPGTETHCNTGRHFHHVLKSMKRTTAGEVRVLATNLTPRPTRAPNGCLQPFASLYELGTKYDENHKGTHSARLLVLGLAFHLVYIGTVFDCYFTSPVVHGMRPHRLPTAEAKRLVLIIGDGLRADFVFSANASAIVPEAPERVAPFLRDIVETRGAYGISHTHVPTESRPGHVATIAGMYEDVSAVTKGWKTNPVDFDSVFNQSSHTFSFGSPDILPMFSHGATPGKVKMWCYNEEEEDFTKDATALDTWVFDHLEALLRNATRDPLLNQQLHEDKVVFFLHLLGLDTTGHSYRPHSKEYMNNIRVVDDIGRKTESLISQFYGDKDTSFIFTADHGMSRIGNHGDGDPDNTRTPIIAWGAGIRRPLPSSSPVDEYSEPWNLGHLARRDVEQADITALMSALLGIDWPVNSVGVLPDVDPDMEGYLRMTDGDAGIATAALTNAKCTFRQVILEHYRVKHNLKKTHTLFYKPFKSFDHLSASDDYPGSSRIAEIERLIFEERFHESRRRSSELIKMALQGLRYLETYDRTLIRAIVTIAYTGWIAFSAVFILAPRNPLTESSQRHSAISFLLASMLIISWILFALQKAPWTFYIYTIFPLYFWNKVIVQIWRASLPWTKMMNVHASRWLKTAIGGALVVITLQSMVSPRRVVYARDWFCGQASHPFQGRWICVTPRFARFSGKLGALFYLIRSSNTLASLQLVLIVASMSVTASSVWNLQAKRGLPLMNQILGWIVLMTASIFPTVYGVYSASAECRFLVYFLTFCPCFVILSIRSEGLFYLSYCATLFLWVKVEEAVRPRPVQVARPGDGNHTVRTKLSEERSWNPNGYRAADVRIALFFLFFVQVGFFGTGNVASISSFYLEPVYRLVPIFNPFLMASLLIFKILAPYVLLSAAFATLNARLGMPPFALFMVALTLTDGMTMSFFFNVTDTGSWLQIGQSISHFCITSLLLVFSAGIAAAGELLMGDSHVRIYSKAE
ncbi:hypothetical protein EW146_g133 [Bondarzewia mesenterica]|uniref:GPI ethanolamine phosphate transferase 1 n=1 Tax=Bondarzewia mesenterica TaxID=1095465 RepID=A0A4S4M7T4_9AGAM|nr:hypothetical protein EW146_g133 [Bondarzewia mesenterica]